MFVFAIVESLLPRWLWVTLFFAWGLFIFFPVVFGVGPIGRVLGKGLNQAAIERAEADKKALEPKQPSTPHNNG
jgi:hypothetical protein